MVVGGQYGVHGGAVFDVEDGVEAIRADLVGTHQAEVARVGEAYRMGAKRPFHLHPVDFMRPRPPLRGPQDDGRPAATFRRAVVTGGELDLSDRRVTLVERRRQVPVHGRGLVTDDETWRV